MPGFRRDVSIVSDRGCDCRGLSRYGERQLENDDAIVDLDRDGKAELLIRTYDEEPSDPYAQELVFDDFRKDWTAGLS